MKAIFSPTGLIVILVILVIIFFPRRPPDLRKPFRKRMRAFPEEPKNPADDAPADDDRARDEVTRD